MATGRRWYVRSNTPSHQHSRQHASWLEVHSSWNKHDTDIDTEHVVYMRHIMDTCMSRGGRVDHWVDSRLYWGYFDGRAPVFKTGQWAEKVSLQSLLILLVYSLFFSRVSCDFFFGLFISLLSPLSLSLPHITYEELDSLWPLSALCSWRRVCDLRRAHRLDRQASPVSSSLHKRGQHHHVCLSYLALSVTVSYTFTLSLYLFSLMHAGCLRRTLACTLSDQQKAWYSLRHGMEGRRRSHVGMGLSYSSWLLHGL